MASAISNSSEPSGIGARIKHIVWDWNGTLIHDLPAVFAATNDAFTSFGLEPVTLEQYQANYMRPVRTFYDRLIGRSLDDEEWIKLDIAFHRAYDTHLHQLALAHGALESLKIADRRGWTQSLLSMFPHDELLPILHLHGLVDLFTRIDGLKGEGRGNAKLPYLQTHIQELALDPATTLLVGDATDDAEAAAAVGAQCVLVESGYHSTASLWLMGVPVIKSLAELEGLLD